MFTLGKVEVLHKAVRTAGTKEDKAPKTPYDLYVNVRVKPGTGIDPETGKDSGKKPTIVRAFSFQKPFIKKYAFDNTFKSDAVNGTIIDGEKLAETFSLSVILNDGKIYFVQVREDFPEIFVFPKSEDPNKKAKSPKATLTSVAEHMAAMGLIENKEGEQKYFNLIPELNEDGTEFSTEEYLRVFRFEAVDVDAPVATTPAATPTVENAPETEDEEPILEDVPEDTDEDEDDDIIE